MANYRSWMLTGYQQSDTIGRHGLQWLHTRGLVNHRYFSDWHDTNLSNWGTLNQSYDTNALDNSNGRYYCRSKGVIFSTVTLMYTNPNDRDFHVALYVNNNMFSLSNDHSAGGNNNGHQWNGATTSMCLSVNEGDYVTCRFLASSGFSSGTRGYIYGGNNTYNNWQVFYLPGAQNNQG
tara:strand:- start:629 stop:1162 length:534 start_codon:yes stop_codon:yes gene_type:complete